ncbi:unnamed protein product [Hymenolepis diminuta]|uniref:Uncharacterized protein n=1 Tax=Hymenolepis diminuta TaxID=6216 RepID=A0A564YT57_HYMDI|nr:unnamed protein product [Hymenolepis diminuta]
MLTIDNEIKIMPYRDLRQFNPPLRAASQERICKQVRINPDRTNLTSTLLAIPNAPFNVMTLVLVGISFLASVFTVSTQCPMWNN